MTLKKVLSKILDLFFPKRCTICDNVINGADGVCNICKKKIWFLTGPVCMICGKKLNQDTVYCYDCSRKKHEFIRNFAVFEYPVIKESLYRFKYKGRAEYASYYAKNAFLLHGKKLMELQADAIIPVPLHASRYRQRGYNQAQEFARELSGWIHVPLQSHCLRRIKPTKALKTMDVLGRQNNLKKAFLFMQNDVKLKTIIVVDDIYTTGSTLDEIARTCKAAGVENVYALTIAVGNGL